MISFSDRRVLGELHPDSTQSARDRQSIHHWPKGGLPGTQSSSLQVPSLSRLPNIRLRISSKSISGETHCRLAKPWPVRLAFQLVAHVGPSTILSDVWRHPEDLTMRDAKLEAIGPFDLRARLTGSLETYQETTTTTWQKN
ncbi:MAG: hypothetical protein ACRD9S_04945 [Pyrinomonadaceae bacterium]